MNVGVMRANPLYRSMDCGRILHSTSSIAGKTFNTGRARALENEAPIGWKTLLRAIPT